MLEFEDRISPLMNGRTIFITGGTGFMGKALLEKILRSSPKINNIYLLIRPRNGQSMKDRLNKIFENSIFDLLRADLKKEDMEALKNKCLAIEGDCSMIDLGISEEDRKLIKERVSIIYHSAATVKFNEALKKSVLLNTRGTREMLALAKECVHLELFAYISTAYCHPEVKLLEEKSYPPPADPHHVIKLVEELEIHEVDQITKKMLGHFPNTYAYTKALAEALVDEESVFLPTLILRPSIVLSTWKEPMPGWADGVTGAMGVLIGVSKGLIRTMVCDPNIYGDYMFVDLAINYFIVATWNFIQNQDNRKILNVVSSKEFRVPIRQLYITDIELSTSKIPLNNIFWYPSMTFTTNRIIFLILAFFLHWLPACFGDAFLFCTGKKPFLYRLQSRITNGVGSMEYYRKNQFNFDNKELLYLRTLLNKEERNKYQIEANGLTVIQFLTTSKLGARKYVLKETDQTLGQARIDMKKMYVAHWCGKVMLMLLFGYAIWKIFCSRILFG